MERAENVARIMLCGFAVPIDLATTSCTPMVSKTARIGPPAITPVPATVEHDVRYAFRKGALSNQPAHSLRRFAVGPAVKRFLQFPLKTGRSSQGHTLAIVDDLSVDVLVGPEHRQARTTLRVLPDMKTRAVFATLVELGFFQHTALLFLAFLASDDFVHVPNSFAFIGLDSAEVANLGSNLSDLLPVGSANGNMRRIRALDGDAVRNWIAHFGAIP